MKISRLIAMTVVMAFMITIKSNAQYIDSTKLKAIRHYSKLLNTDTATSRKVNEVYDNYKAAVKKVWANTSLTEEQKRSQTSVLMDQKNQKLGLLLTPAQMERIVPTTERRRTWKPDTTTRVKHQ